ncbi:MAG: hypothetical protein H0T42_11815 [Deltaproteobacteria bacterium]|nr:hypothetical protein [Deltaproteobacteria bacterium]
MIRLIVFLVLAAGFIWFGSSVNLGKRTLFGHVRAIWATDEVQDLKQGVEQKAAPAVDRVKRGVKAGINAAKDDEGSGSTAGSDSGSGTAGGVGSGSAVVIRP